jgi:hypothetical protein
MSSVIDDLKFLLVYKNEFKIDFVDQETFYKIIDEEIRILKPDNIKSMAL